MENTKRRASKIDNPKTSLILNGITAAIWTFITLRNILSLNKLTHVNSLDTYLTGALAIFYIGMTVSDVIKYRKEIISENIQ